MIPETIPVFTYDDIIEPPAKEYEEGDRKTAVGWLKHLFLFDNVEGDPNLIWITPESRKFYQKALDLLRAECTMKRGETAEDWEETATRKAQAVALNKVRKKLGYTEEYYQ